MMVMIEHHAMAIKWQNKPITKCNVLAHLSIDCCLHICIFKCAPTNLTAANNNIIYIIIYTFAVSFGREFGQLSEIKLNFMKKGAEHHRSFPPQMPAHIC